MRTKLILWGKTEKDEKVLVAIELVEQDNAVKTYVFKEEDATEEFYNLLKNEWVNDHDVEFPSGYQTFEKPLTAAEDILPEGILVDKPDMINRAKTEWHFVVLSKKLYDLYKGELEELKDKISDLSEFSSEYWEELKTFWTKVQGQIREKNLFRNHVESLKTKTDTLFDELKKFRKEADAQFREKSQEAFNEFSEILDKVEEKIDKGLGLQPIFEELKSIQRDFKNIKFDRDHRRKLWNRIDKYFKIVKEKRFGNSSNDRNPVNRIERRLNGLLGAIDKMQASINRDKRDLENQNSMISDSDGQLEVQLRQARLMMIEERIASKSEKLKDMLETKEMLEKRMENEKKKEEEKLRFEEAKRAAQEKIKEKVKESSELLKKNEEELKKASEKLKEAKKATSPPQVVEEPKKEKEEPKKEKNDTEDSANEEE